MQSSQSADLQSTIHVFVCEIPYTHSNKMHTNKIGIWLDPPIKFQELNFLRWIQTQTNLGGGEAKQKYKATSYSQSCLEVRFTFSNANVNIYGTALFPKKCLK